MSMEYMADTMTTMALVCFILTIGVCGAGIRLVSGILGMVTIGTTLGLGLALVNSDGGYPGLGCVQTVLNYNRINKLKIAHHHHETQINNRHRPSRI